MNNKFGFLKTWLGLWALLLGIGAIVTSLVLIPIYFLGYFFGGVVGLILLIGLVTFVLVAIARDL